MKNVEKKKRNVKEEEIENEFVDEILKKKKKEGSWCRTQFRFL